jgi:hypothetical protein
LPPFSVIFPRPAAAARASTALGGASTWKLSPASSIGDAAGGSSDSMSIALSAVTARSSAVVTPSACQPEAGSIGFTHGGATSTWLSDAPGGSRNSAA